MGNNAINAFICLPKTAKQGARNLLRRGQTAANETAAAVQTMTRLVNLPAKFQRAAALLRALGSAQRMRCKALPVWQVVRKNKNVCVFLWHWHTFFCLFFPCEAAFSALRAIKAPYLIWNSDVPLRAMGQCLTMRLNLLCKSSRVLSANCKRNNDTCVTTYNALACTNFVGSRNHIVCCRLSLVFRE